MDALGIPANIIGNTPKLLFHTVFAGMSLSGTPYSQGSLKNWIVDFSDSTDSTTGYDIDADLKTLWGSNTQIGIQNIPQSNLAADGSDFATYFAPSLATNQLTLQCSARHSTGSGTGNPQCTLMVSRTAAQAAANDINELCVMLYAKLPAGLDLQAGNTATGKFFEVGFEIKSGGYGGASGVGDIRYKLEVLGNNGSNEWAATVDNEANGRGTIPSVESALTQYYRNFSGVAPTLNTWTKCYVYFNRSKGRVIMAVEPDGGVFSVIGDASAPDFPTLNYTLYGHERLPITRMFLGLNYTSATLPAATLIKEVQIWDKMPIELV